MTVETRACRDCGIQTEPQYLEDGLCPECDAKALELNGEKWRDL